MTITVTVDEQDARAMFGQVCGDASEGSYCALMPGCPCELPTVKWLVVGSPLVCPTCDGKEGHTHNLPGDTLVPCRDCSGTGLPKVKVVSLRPIIAMDGDDDATLVNHGVITLGAAVPIISEMQWVAASRTPKAIVVCADGVVLDPLLLKITDQFGSQDVAPGRWAHSIVGAA